MSRFQARIDYLLANQHLASAELQQTPRGIVRPNCCGTIAFLCDIKLEPEFNEVEDWVIPGNPGYIGQGRMQAFLATLKQGKQVDSIVSLHFNNRILQIPSGEFMLQHVAIYLGEDMIFHQPANGKNFEITELEAYKRKIPLERKLRFEERYSIL